MLLHDYFRSSAAYRVRIALNLKRLEYDAHSISLVEGEQRGGDYTALNPQGLVPALELDGGPTLTQSLAIIEYLEETHPEPALLPADAPGRARVRALAQLIACDIHPLNNLRVLNYLTGTLGLADEAKLGWYRHWIGTGLAALEAFLNQAAPTMFCHGESPTMADICLVPQVFNAKRFDCDLAPYPTVMRVAEHCKSLPAFAKAHPAQQADAN